MIILKILRKLENKPLFQLKNSDESLYLDEPDLFSDFDLEEVQRAKGISISTNENVFETPKSDTSSDKGSSKVSNSSKVEKEDKKEEINDDEKKDEQEEVDLR